jgi:hypothetical protein
VIEPNVLFELGALTVDVVERRVTAVNVAAGLAADDCRFGGKVVEGRVDELAMSTTRLEIVILIRCRDLIDERASDVTIRRSFVWVKMEDAF